MVGKKWSYVRRFKALSPFNKLGVIGAICGIIALPLGFFFYLYPKTPDIQLSDKEKQSLEQNNISIGAVESILQAIQEERNEAINDSAQIEFVELISNIYKTIDPHSSIKLNEITIDSISGRNYRSDIIIESQVLGAKIKLLLRVYPYNNPLGQAEIENFQTHIEAVNASKGMIITRGKYRKDAFALANKKTIDLSTFLDSKTINWNDNMKVPVIVKLLWPEMRCTFSFKAIKNSAGFYFDSKLKRENDTTTIRLFDLFTDKWNSDEINKDENNKGILLIENDRWVLETVEGWVKISNIKFTYEVKNEYRFKYLNPKNFIELKNLSSDKIIYAQYEFNKSAFDSIKRWQHIKNISDHLKTISNQVTLTAIEILSGNDFELGKVEMIIKERS